MYYFYPLGSPAQNFQQPFQRSVPPQYGRRPNQLVAMDQAAASQASLPQRRPVFANAAIGLARVSFAMHLRLIILSFL